MQIKSLAHTYAKQVASHFTNSRYSTTDPIGMVNRVTQKTIDEKSANLRNFLSQYNLHNIAPANFAKLGGTLFESGDISENSAALFIFIGRSNPNQNSPFDAVKAMESYYASVKKTAATHPYFENALKFASDALHTAYNLDNFIQGIRTPLGIDAKA